jgi:hypothetical protein
LWEDYGINLFSHFSLLYHDFKDFGGLKMKYEQKILMRQLVNLAILESKYYIDHLWKDSKTLLKSEKKKYKALVVLAKELEK